MTQNVLHGIFINVIARATRTRRVRASSSASVLRSRAMEDFLDDIGAEVEVNPDEVEVVKIKKAQED